MVTLVIVGLWLLKPQFIKSSTNSVLAVATNVSSEGLLEETNEQRTANQKSSLRLNAQLSAAAQAKAQDMVSRNYWSHNTPEGSPPWTFVIDHGYQYQKAGENLAHGFKDSNETIIGWMNSPTHRQNLLDSSYADVGFGIANSSDFNQTGPTTVIVAMYGRSLSETPLITLVSEDGTGTKSYNSELANPPTLTTQSVSRADILSGTKYPWITPLVTFVMGAALAAYLVKHSIGIKRAFKKGEKFVISHPVLDTILVGIILGGLLLTRQMGAIL